MSQQISSVERTGVASEDLRLKKHYIVQLDAHGKIEVGEGATDFLVGILQNKPNTGEAAIYRFGGTAKVIVGAPVNPGSWVTTDSAGKAIETTSDGDTTVGRALETATAAGQLLEIQVNVQHLYIA